MLNPDKPKVSVCIPVYNGENFIEECIKSVLEQGYNDYELIIVDNCSTDSTFSIVNGMNDARIRYVRNEENIGSIRNFNECIKQAKGELFLLLPHDDLLLPESLAKFVHFFNDPAIGFSYSSFRVINADGDITRTKINHLQNHLFTCEEAITDIVDYFVPIQLAMVRTQILKQLDGFDSKYALFCDVHLWLRIIFDGWKAFYNSEPLSCHRVHEQQGQNAFLNPDIKILSKHWGKKLDRSFWKENSYSYLFLKLIQFILVESNKKAFKVEHIENVLLRLLARSHVRSLSFALFRFNWFIFWQEIMIFKHLRKQYPISKIISSYLTVFVKETKNQINKRLNSHSH